MNLAKVILENERLGESRKNKQLVSVRLKELVYGFPSEVSKVLQKTGVKINSQLPSKVIHAIVLKHLSKNSFLRETISKMLLELEDYHNADGKWTGIIGGALSAVGSVLSGIGRGQLENSPQQLDFRREQMQLEQERQRQQAQRRSRTFMVVGISLVVVAGIIVAIRMIQKGKLTKVKTA